MSRFKRFTHSLLSGYFLLGANILYTFVSVPLALNYLSKAEFGLWLLTSQIATYLSLLDMGMGSSVARILIDHKDERGSGRYGGVIKAGLLVGAGQGGIVLLAGLTFVWFLAGWLGIAASLSQQFFWLMAGQIVIAALSFATRIFGQILSAWQRMDIHNYAMSLQLIVGLAVLWLGFEFELGVYSLLAAGAAGWIFVNVACATACWRMGFWPRREEWGTISKYLFNEMFFYAGDMFLIALGTQLILSSQVVLVTRLLGIEAATLWSVMTRAFALVAQVLTRIITTSMPALGEMQVRGEVARLWRRYRDVFETVGVFGVWCAVLFGACNGPFVSLWVGGQISWPQINDLLLAAWLVGLTQQACHNGLIMSLKQIREIKFTYLAEGVVFVGVSSVVIPHAGLTGVIAASVVCTALFTWANGWRRVATLARENNQPPLRSWHWPLLRAMMILLPPWAALEWVLHNANEWTQLILKGSCLGIAGLWACLIFALPRSLAAELLGRLPSPAQRFTSWLTRVFRLPTH